MAGDFDTTSVPQLIQHLGDRKLTGTLSVERGSLKKSFAVRSGAACSASSSDPREYLGQFFINFGYITEEDLAEAFQKQAQTGVLLGRVLRDMGLVTEEKVRQILAIKIRESLLEVYRWSGGSFQFERDVLPKGLAGIELEVPLLDIQREAEFRDTAWKAIEQIFPSGNLTLKLVAAKAPQVDPHSVDGRLLATIREGLSIDEILLTLHATDFHLYQRLYALYRQGAITVGPPREMPETVGEEVGAEDILAHARQFLADGQLVAAQALAARAVEIARSPEAQALLQETESKLAAELRSALLAKPRVPHLTVAHARIKEMPLSPPEKYLLSRIDGKRDLLSLIRVSPLRELDALKIFQRFLDQGLVKLG